MCGKNYKLPHMGKANLGRQDPFVMQCWHNRECKTNRTNRTAVKSAIKQLILDKKNQPSRALIAEQREYLFVINFDPIFSLKAGKSTYLKMIALQQIMAQLGSYVPSKSAIFRLTDQIFSRIGHNDDLENNLSAFQVEVSFVNLVLTVIQYCKNLDDRCEIYFGQFNKRFFSNYWRIVSK